MSLSFLSDISYGATLNDAVDYVAGNEIVAIGASTLKSYGVPSGSIRLSIGTTNANNRSVCMVTSACACVWAGATTVDLVELSGGYKVNYSSVQSVPTAQAGQQSAGDTTNGIALAVTQNSNGQLSKFTGSTFTGSTFTVTPVVNEATTFSCITLKTAGRWIAGCNNGTVVEIDSSGTVYKQFKVPQQPNANYVSTTTPAICGLSFDGTDFLAVTTTAGYLYVYSYNTLTLLYVMPFGANGSGTTFGTSLCVASCGTTFLGYNYTGSVNNVIGELDFSQSPPKVRDVLFTDSTGVIFACGVQNAVGWVCQSSANKIRMFTVSSRTTTNVSSLIQNPPGSNITGRIIRIVDGGVGTAYVDVDAMITNASTSLPVVDGVSYLEIALINSGVNVLADIKRNQS